MKIKTAEASKKQLDWGAAVVAGLEPELAHHECYRDGVVVLAHCFLKAFSREYKQGFSHADPAVCMGLIKEYCIQLYPFCDGEIVRWDADIRPDVRVVNCDTPEQAVARCVIAMKLGDEFECPDELALS